MKGKQLLADKANSLLEIMFQESEKTSWRSKETPNEARWLKSDKKQKSKQLSKVSYSRSY